MQLLITWILISALNMAPELYVISLIWAVISDIYRERVISKAIAKALKGAKYGA